MILEAVLDLTPTLVQGIAKYIPGRAGIYVSAAGIVLQTGKGLYELSNQYLENRAGGVINKEALLASLGRITSAVTNALGVALPKGGAAANTFNALGTAAATAATTADITNRFHQSREKAAPREMYPGLHRNPPLGYRAGQFQPGAAPTTVHSSQDTTPAVPHSAPALGGQALGTRVMRPSADITSSHGISSAQPPAGGSYGGNGKAPTGQRQRR
ncbi:hypothetical protein [Streptomyces sp. NPDC059850]|uniref:hypothetical protein n=1 Tax=Streptomyces sp. NPDC059850 TaxID=3346970 RepID=UPI00364A1F72